MSTKIVELTLPFHDVESSNNTTLVKNSNHIKNHSISTTLDGLDGFLNNDYLDCLNSGCTPSQSVSQVNISSNPQCEEITSSATFYGFDDFNSGLFLEDDDYLSPYGNGFSPFPESPSVEDLRSKLGNMQKPSMSGQKQEKEEDNEEESGESSSSEDNEEELVKKEEPEGFQEEVLRPIKKTRLGVQRNDSCSSISSYSSGASSDEENENENEHELDLEDDFDEFDEEEEDESSKKKSTVFVPRKYKQPASLRADDLTIGNWSLKKMKETDPEIFLDVKILFGRRKIKYEINFPQKNSKYKNTLSMDFPFTFVAALEFKSTEKKVIFQLCERPTFSKKEKGKCGRSADFTEGSASTYQRHHIIMENSVDYNEFMESLLNSDRKLRQLAKVGLSPIETTFPNDMQFGGIPPCDWDKDNRATKHCEDCKANYCDVCDDVLHRHETQKTHRRIPVQIYVKPIPKPKKAGTKKRKKMNSDRCRCGTGATKGTLGEPCTGNRCPCFSNGKSCVSCGCKGCANPIKRNPRSPSVVNVRQVPTEELDV